MIESTRTPTAEQVEAFAPALFALCDRVADVSLETGNDLDLECFDAVCAVMQGHPLEVVLGYIDVRHPSADEARELLSALWAGRQGSLSA